MDQAVLDGLVVFFAVLYYAFLCAVYFLRAFELSRAELWLAPAFSLLLIPFIGAFIANIFIGSDSYRPITLVPMISYLVYDLWYRLLTQRKPVHHPEKWPPGLVVYLLLLQAGSIGLNWYGYLASKMYGQSLVACYFIMLGFFGFYQGRYNKRKIAAKHD
jgi:hypothetical protein